MRTTNPKALIDHPHGPLSRRNLLTAAAPVSFSASELQELDAALAAISIRGARLSPQVLAATGRRGATEAVMSGTRNPWPRRDP